MLASIVKDHFTCNRSDSKKPHGVPGFWVPGFSAVVLGFQVRLSLFRENRSGSGLLVPGFGFQGARLRIYCHSAIKNLLSFAFGN